MANNYCVFKLIILGNSGVGKSSLMLRFTDNAFSCENYRQTIGVDFKTKTVSVADRTVKLQIWDTAGQERFRSVTTTYYRGAHGLIVVYDVTNPKSFEAVSAWLEEVQVEDTILVGNKNDTPCRKAVPTEEAHRFAQRKGIGFFETSAKDNINVEEMFRDIAIRILRRKMTSSPSATKSVKIDGGGRKSKNCCSGKRKTAARGDNAINASGGQK